jgi:Domain of unknown function (DUF4352)
MRRYLSLLVVVVALLANSPHTVAAQDPATPVPPEGTGVTIYGEDGQPEGIISVSRVVEPYVDYEPSSSPRSGYHYMMAMITVTSTSDTTMKINNHQFYVVDSYGFDYFDEQLERDATSREAKPDFAGGLFKPGESKSGALFFMVFDGAQIDLIHYEPFHTRLATILDLRDAPVAEGDPIEIFNDDGSPGGAVTIVDRLEPLPGVTSASEPGFDFVGILVTIENTTNAPLEYWPYDFFITDEKGLNYFSYGAFRDNATENALPSLSYDTLLQPGASITGVVSYNVPTGTRIGMVYYSQGFGRHIRLAEYAEERAPTLSGDALTISVAPPTERTPVAAATPVPPSANCEGVVEWFVDTSPSLLRLTLAYLDMRDVLAGGIVSAAIARDVADSVAGLAETQRQIQAPAIARASHDALIASFELSAIAFNELATAVESGNDPAVRAAAFALSFDVDAQMASSAADSALTALIEQCPEINPGIVSTNLGIAVLAADLHA